MGEEREKDHNISMSMTLCESIRNSCLRRQGFWLLVFLVTAFALRLLATLMYEGLESGPSIRAFGADALEFNAIAAGLAGRGEYAIEPQAPTSMRAPGFPFALAGIYAVFGVNNFFAAHVFFCLIGAALPLAVFLLAREVARINVALVAAGLVAVYPNVLYYSMHFCSEPLFTLLLTLSLWSLLRAVKSQRLGRDASPYLEISKTCMDVQVGRSLRLSRGVGYYALSGILLGLAALTRPLAFYFFPFYVMVALWVGRRQWKATLVGCGLFVVLLMLPIVPWTIRNYQVHHRYLMIAANGGVTFWGANNERVMNNPKTRGGWISTNRMPLEKAEVMKHANEVDRDRLEWGNGKAFLRSHVRDLPRLAWYKFCALWTPFCDTPNRKFNLIIGLSYGCMLPLMAWGLWLFVRTRGVGTPETLVLIMPVIATVLSCLVVYGAARFRSTIEPILLIFAAEAIVRIVGKKEFRQNEQNRHNEDEADPSTHSLYSAQTHAS